MRSYRVRSKASSVISKESELKHLELIMATGLVEFLLNLRRGLLKDEENSPARGGTRVEESARAGRRRDDTSMPTPLQREPCKTRPAFELCAKGSHGNYMERLPSEIILKIFSFLDASSLFNISFVNKRFHDLANSNALWSVLYASEIEKKMWRPPVSMMKEAVSSTVVEEKPAGYWKKLLLKEMAGYKDTMWKTELKHMNPHTGMPALTEHVLRRLDIQWEITLTNRNGREIVYKQTHTFFEDSSVTVCWNHGIWPLMYTLNTLQLHGIMCPASPAPGDKPRWRSLIRKTALQRTGRWSFFGADRLVKVLQFDKGILIGLWRGNWKIAFIMVNLHFHKLIERSLLGSRFCPYMPADDSAVDPDCSRHGYTLHIVLHNPVRQILCRRFSPLYTRRVMPQREFVQLIAIDFANVSEHVPVAKISLPWQAEGLKGEVERCCMMTLTVLDEAQRPFWCASSTVKMYSRQRVLELEYEGEQFIVLYEDAEGKVKMTFVWMEEVQHYFLVQLVTIFPADKVQRHFSGEC
ncbi:F-box only protein 15 [Carassius gibelio]|uniref:F-box only protein 15 n=1 Tax=Carassius gibelio TaxID=101364 RepID=UPI002278803D|nr:F-box only protein 15 [Carassius gibelio]